MIPIRTIPKLLLFSAAAAIVIIAFSPGPRAQANADRGKTQEALERTDEVIGNARHVTDESRSQKARLSLEIAEGIQARAWGSFRNDALRAATKLTLEAREAAWRVIALARSDNQFEQNQVRVLEETAERLARLRDLVADSGVRDEQATKLMDQSRSLLEKSRLNAQQLRYQLSLKLADNARDLAVRAEEHIRNTRILKESAERRLALLERLIERARERVQERDREQARLQIGLAEEQLAKSRELLDNGRYREARQALERCEKTLRSSARLVPLASAGDPQSQVDEAYRLLERAGEIASDAGESADPKMLEAMERSRAMLHQAEEALSTGHADEAMNLVALVRESLRTAFRAETGEMTRERLTLGIERVEALREETRNLADSCPTPGVKELMERAQEHVRLARENTESGNYEGAVAEIAIARNLYRRISELCAR